MKKISIFLLTILTLLFTSVYYTPDVFADTPTYEFNYQVVTSTQTSGVGSTIEMNFGSTTFIDVSGLSGEFGYFILDGQLIYDNQTEFVISASTNVTVIMKDQISDVVTSFVDTNGEFLGAVYNPIDAPTISASLSKPGYSFTGFGVTSADTDAVYMAKYSRTNTAAINVDIIGGSADLESIQYNDIVTLTPNPGNFSYWADGNGQVVSRNAEYKFSALQDIQLTAMFDQAANNEPLVYLYDVTGLNPGHQSFMGYVEGEFIEYGIIASQSAGTLTMDTAGIVIIPSSSLNPVTNEFLRSIPESLGYISFRAYAKYANGDVVYSESNFTSVDPFEGFTAITTPQEFITMTQSENNGNQFYLVNDLDFTGVTWNQTATGTAFRGYLDGNNKTLSNIKITSSGYMGIFQRLNGATVKNLNIINSDATGTRGGILIGRLENNPAVIENVTIENITINGNDSNGVGILIGQVSNGLSATNISIINSSVTNLNKNSGSFIGRIDNSNGKVNASNIILKDNYVNTSNTGTDAGNGLFVGYIANTAGSSLTADKVIVIGGDGDVNDSRGVLIGYLRAPGVATITNSFVDVEFTEGALRTALVAHTVAANTLDFDTSSIYGRIINTVDNSLAIQLNPSNTMPIDNQLSWILIQIPSLENDPFFLDVLSNYN